MNELLTIAKEVIIKHHKKNKAMSFNDLWKKTASIAKMNSNDDDLISEFYLLLLEDPNFIKLTNNEWTLKQFFSYSEVEKMSGNVYKTDEFEINEGEYDKFMSKYEINELKHNSRNSDTAALELEEFENEDLVEDDDTSTDTISDDDYDE